MSFLLDVVTLRRQRVEKSARAHPPWRVSACALQAHARRGVQQLGRKGFRPYRTLCISLHKRPDGSRTHTANLFIVLQYHYTALHTQAQTELRPEATTKNARSTHALLRACITAAARPARMPKMRRQLACTSAAVAARHHQPRHLRHCTETRDRGKGQGREDEKRVKWVDCLARRPGQTLGATCAGSDLPRTLARPSGSSPRTCLRRRTWGALLRKIAWDGTSRARSARSSRPISTRNLACTRRTDGGSVEEGSAGTHEAVVTRAARQKCDADSPVRLGAGGAGRLARAARGRGVGEPSSGSFRMMVKPIPDRQQRVLDVVLVARTASTASCACREGCGSRWGGVD